MGVAQLACVAHGSDGSHGGAVRPYGSEGCGQLGEERAVGARRVAE